MSKKLIFIIITTIALLSLAVLPISWFSIMASWFYLFDEKMFIMIYPAVYSIIAIISSIYSFFSIKGMNPNKIYNKPINIFLLIINIITIITVLTMIVLNKGIIHNF